ncbi:MAG: hypothetical protein CFE23_16640 [Flavobacterium sp. BFFFF1]|nr:MAG: hypothetical protein CFE23_16640 [Flavobacterium sp. BFFFF1]
MLFSTFVSAQNDTINTPEVLLHKAQSDSYYKLLDSINTYYDAETEKQVNEIIKTESLKSLVYYDQLITQFPNSELVFDALYNKAQITYSYLDTNLAYEIFLKVVNFNTKKTAYKHRAFRALAEIEIEKKNFEKAMSYLDESCKYPIYFDCGVPWEIDTSQLRIMYTKCFDGLRGSKN